MDAVTYLKEKKRMCDAVKDGCENCPMQGCKGCGSIELEDPEEAVDCVQTWSKEHPKRTNGDAFKEEYGDYAYYIFDGNKPYVEVRFTKDWWNEEIED